MDKKILFVDKSKSIRDALSLFFEFEKYEFLAVETPQEALKVLRNDTYDIIIADYNLPGINGLEFLNQVNSDFPKTIEILTAFYDDRNIVRSAREAGIKNIILKPFSAMTLIRHLTRVFEKELKNEKQRPEKL